MILRVIFIHFWHFKIYSRETYSVIEYVNFEGIGLSFSWLFIWRTFLWIINDNLTWIISELVKFLNWNLLSLYRFKEVAMLLNHGQMHWSSKSQILFSDVRAVDWGICHLTIDRAHQSGWLVLLPVSALLYHALGWRGWPSQRKAWVFG